MAQRIANPEQLADDMTFMTPGPLGQISIITVSYTHLRAHET